MLFDELLQKIQADGDTWRAPLTDDWLQGRSGFGGLQVALALKAMRARVGEQPLRVLQATFLAPVPAGEVHARARVLRSGKNAVHVQGELFDGEQLLCQVVGIFGASRPSVVAIRPERPVVDNPGARVLPYLPAMMPAFLQHFDMRWLAGPLPASGGDEAKAVIEVGFKSGESSGGAGELHLATLADVIPPLALGLLKQPAAISSMTWMLEFLADDYARQPLQGWRFDAEVLSAGSGYTSQTAMIWAPDGSPGMLSRQNMVVFA